PAGLVTGHLWLLRMSEMKFSTKLALTTAVSLFLATGAYAQSNEAHIDQIGDYNTSSIDQSAAGLNKAGSTADNILQNGDYNVLEIDQVGSSNRAGVPGSQVGLGIDQKDNQNTLTIMQSA